MKIALICPSNKHYMPYLRGYEQILNEVKAEYTIINWDRFDIEERNNFIFRDNKVGHRRNYFDYYKYKNFLIERLNEIGEKYDKLIIFGLQLSYFLRKLLVNKYSGKYIIDIRDYNKIIRFFNIKKVIECSALTVISSPGFKLWAPDSNKVIINHNTNISSINNLENPPLSSKDTIPIQISYIGSLRDYEINSKLILSLKNNNNFSLLFHGEGTINNKLQDLVNNNRINNVKVTGRYRKTDEVEFYNDADIINVLIPTNDINSKTLLPNRLYNAVVKGKPILAFRGTFLAELVENKKLGLIIDSFDNLEEKLFNYFNKLDFIEFNQGRKSFIECVISDNEHYTKRLKEFISE
jgi:hypothetical protein